MTAIRSIETARTEDMTAKPAFRGCRAIVAAAAVVACGLLAAPLQAGDATYDATVTLTATVGADDTVTLVASVNPLVTGPRQQTGFLFREWQGDADPGEDDLWVPIGGVDESSTSIVIEPLGDGPFYFQARGWRMRAADGTLHYELSEPSEKVTVDL